LESDLQVLNEFELRVLASLVEKQLATPDYYPMTINALTNACNQKSHRDPVVAYDEATVQRALDTLRAKHLVYTFHGSESRTIKYGHLFPKGYELNDGETVIMCVLILRGPQTPGELRSRTGHLLQFESLARVEEVLNDLASRQSPLVARLPRLPNARESRFAQLLGGDVQAESAPVERSERRSSDTSRFERLESEVAALRQEVVDLRQILEEFRKQFE
jgi:uncharacterized protein